MNHNIIKEHYKISQRDREQRNNHTAKCIWFTGLSGSGKSTLVNLLEVELHNKGLNVYVLDGDNMRLGLNHDLGFSDADRTENIRRTAEVAKLFVDAGMIVLSACITPFEEHRKHIKKTIGADNFVQVYVDCPLDVCKQRDVKGLYKKAQQGDIDNFTGITSPFETPLENDVTIFSDTESHEQSLEKLLSLILQQINE